MSGPSFQNAADIEDARARAMMRKVVAAVGPIADLVAEGGLLASDVLPEPVQAAEAIAKATGRRVDDVEYVSARRVIAGAERIEWSHRVTLKSALEERYGFRVLTRLGRDRWDRLRRHFGYGATEPLTVVLADRLRLPKENLRSAMFHFWGLALAREDAILDDLVPLMELCACGVPVGETHRRPGRWSILIG